MILRRSHFLHLLQLGPGRFLAVHALTQLRLGLDAEAARLVAWFETPRRLPEDLEALPSGLGHGREVLAHAIASLLERGVLSEAAPAEEIAEAAERLNETRGRDPGEMIQRYRRARREGAEDYWSLAPTRDLAALAAGGRRVDAIFLGDCDVQMESNFLAEEGLRRGLDLRVAASFPSDLDIVAQRRHDVVIVGAMSSRFSIAEGSSFDPDDWFIPQARRLLAELRARTRAPILIDGLPEPTVSPLGFADRGPNGHRSRFRRANLALEDMIEAFFDVHMVDVAAALNAAGSAGLVDDGLTSFTHFGSPGWMLQRPASERAAVHDIFPDPAPLEAQLDGDPFKRERLMANVHLDAMTTVLAIDRKKCVIVDLDGVLWPGVLAETGAPFAWSPETSGPHSYVGLYFGLHEALKSLKKRGVLLAAVSKNDEAVVRKLWAYPDHYPRHRLLSPDDFVALRINWADKAENVASIAEELGFATDSFIVIDDHPVERERLRVKAPEIEVWGEDPFALRRRLLTDPRLQSPRSTREAESRTALVRAQLDRARQRSIATDEATFLATLDIRADIQAPEPGASIDRIHELLTRTTQFNATGRVFAKEELARLSAAPDAGILAMRVSDRFGEHGLVGVVVFAGSEIEAFVLSCRVIGLEVERLLLRAALDKMAERGCRCVIGSIVETARNTVVRNLYRDAGFTQIGGGRWRLELAPDRNAYLPDHRAVCRIA